MEVRSKRKEFGYKNKIILLYRNDVFCLTPCVGIIYNNIYDYRYHYESVSFCIGLLFWWIKFEHIMNIENE